MVKFSTTILQFKEQGEKTGWTYIEIPRDIGEKLKPGQRRSFRVKGKIDRFPVEGIALLPIKGKGFIMALNAAIRKGIGKSKGAIVKLQLEADDNFSIILPPELMECLQDEPKALAFFQKLTKGHQDYFIKWVISAKTEETKARRMGQMIAGLARGQDFGMMLRSLKQDRADLMGK
jgi:Bacteriocin-protection, YdeI or OmpD-Associated/Domain of unknown function (DUF1905)